MRSRVMIVFC